MTADRSLLLSTLAFTLSTILAGCGAGGTFTGSSTTPIGAAAPTVLAVGLQVNGVAPNRAQEVQFSEAMDATTIGSQTFQVTDAAGKAAQGTVTYDGDLHVASFRPNPALQPNAKYTATLTTGVASAEGVHLADNYSYTFETRSDTDKSPIYVTSVAPFPNETCVAASSEITINFSEAPDANTLQLSDIFLTSANGSVLPERLTINIGAAVVTLTPLSPLPSGSITLTVQNVADLAGVAMTSAFYSTFSTACGGAGSGGGPGFPNSAYVYVSNPGSNSANPHGSQIFGFAANPSGALTAVSGSPYSVATGQAVEMAAAGQYLFVNNYSTIASYSIGSAGALAPAAGYATPRDGGGPISLFLDRSGQTLYGLGASTRNGNNAYQAYSGPQTDSLAYVGQTANGDPTDAQLSFTQDDKFAYGSDCHFGSLNFYGYARGGSGALTYFDPKANVPATPPNTGGTSYCPYGAAAPSSSYVVIALQLGTDPYSYTGINQLAVYSVGGNGTLHTSNTASTMPTLTVGSANDYRFDPTGTYLAVGGNGGVEIFSFASGTLTPTGTVPLAGGVSQLAWDNVGHLYTYGQDSGSLYALNVVHGVPAIAIGSPHALPIYGFLAVQPLN